MALTINPAVSGSRKRFLLHSSGFFLGVFVGALGSLLVVLVLKGLLAAIVPDKWVVLGALALVGWAVLHDVGLPAPLPYRPGQVPEWLRSALPTGAVATAFGMQLGVGFLTFFTYSTHLAMLLALPFLRSLSEMILVVALFAFGKSLVLATTIGTRSVDQVTSRFRWTRARTRVLRGTTATASLLVGLALLQHWLL